MGPAGHAAMLTHTICCITLDDCGSVPTWLQVYRGTWRETPVAIKLLIDSSHNLDDDADAEMMLSHSNPIMCSLLSVSLSGLLGSRLLRISAQEIVACTHTQHAKRFQSSGISIGGLTCCTRTDCMHVLTGTTNELHRKRASWPHSATPTS